MSLSSLKDLLVDVPSWMHVYTRKYQLKAVMRMNDLLREKEMTQKEVAEHAGWSKGYVSRILSGRENITLRTLARFEDAVGGDVLMVADTPKTKPIAKLVAQQKAGSGRRVAVNDYSYASAKLESRQKSVNRTEPESEIPIGPGQAMRDIAFRTTYGTEEFDATLLAITAELSKAHE